MRRPLEEALIHASAVADLLRDGCARIEIAGSIRRRAPDCKDIEIVCVAVMQRDLFGGPGDDILNATVRRRVGAGLLQWRDPKDNVGTPEPKDLRDRRYYALATVEDEPWPIDLFCVRPPAQWGAIMAIRTGPADYSQRLVTVAYQKQLKCAEGRLVSLATATSGDVVDTPEERDFFAAIGVEYVEPGARHAGRA